MSTTLVCTGTIDLLSVPPACSVPWIAADTGLGFDVSQLDPVVVVQAFSAGAVIVFPPFAIAWAAGIVVSSIRGR